MRDPLSRVRIKYKLTGAFIVVCLLAFGVGGYLISVSAGSALEREISLRLKAEGVALARELSARLHLFGRRAEDFASDGFIRTRMEDVLHERENARLRLTESAVYRQLAEHLATNKLPIVRPLAGLALSDMDGQMLSGVGRVQLQLPESLLLEGARKDTLWCSSFINDAADGRLYFALCTPLWNIARTKRLGSLLFWIDAEEWTRSVFLDAPMTPDILLSGHLVSISDQRGRKLTLYDYTRSVTGAGVIPGVNSKDAQWTEAGTAQGQSSSTGFYTQDHDIEGHGWRVHVAVNAQQAMLPVSGLQSSFLGAGLLIALVSLVLLYFPVRFLVKPLAAMSDAARAMTAGDFSRRVDEQAEDEIGHLARSFNLMAEATQERTARLENTARELEQQRRELRIERDLLDTVVHSMDDAVLYHDREGAVLLHNAAAEPLHRRLCDESYTLSPRHCGCDNASERDCRTCLLDHRMPARDCVLEVGDRIFEVVSTSIACQGTLGGTVLVGRDITNRLRIDENQAHQDRLAVLGEVSAVMAHELNNPLAAIRMFAQMMKKEMHDGAAYTEHLEVILRNTDSCERTIRYLLSYSRCAASGGEECDLHELLPDVVRFLRPLYEKANVCFDLDLFATSPVLDVDETLLRQVFVNLVMNALQAMSGSGGRIVLRSFESAEADTITIDIIDNGPGVPPEHAEAVFEPFFTSKPSGKGTGLGLSISRRIVESLGGSLLLLASKPRETIFRVTLPRRCNPKQLRSPFTLERAM